MKHVKHAKSFVLYTKEVLALILGKRSAVLTPDSVMSTNLLVCDKKVINKKWFGGFAMLEKQVHVIAPINEVEGGYVFVLCVFVSVCL